MALGFFCSWGSFASLGHFLWRSWGLVPFKGLFRKFYRRPSHFILGAMWFRCFQEGLRIPFWSFPVNYCVPFCWTCPALLGQPCVLGLFTLGGLASGNRGRLRSSTCRRTRAPFLYNNLVWGVLPSAHSGRTFQPHWPLHVHGPTNRRSMRCRPCGGWSLLFYPTLDLRILLVFFLGPCLWIEVCRRCSYHGGGFPSRLVPLAIRAIQGPFRAIRCWGSCCSPLLASDVVCQVIFNGVRLVICIFRDERGGAIGGLHGVTCEGGFGFFRRLLIGLIWVDGVFFKGVGNVCPTTVHHRYFFARAASYDGATSGDGLPYRDGVPPCFTIYGYQGGDHRRYGANKQAVLKSYNFNYVGIGVFVFVGVKISVMLGDVYAGGTCYNFYQFLRGIAREANGLGFAHAIRGERFGLRCFATSDDPDGSIGGACFVVFWGGFQLVFVFTRRFLGVYFFCYSF